VRKNPLRGLTCGCVEEKEAYNYKENFLLIFHPFAEKPPWRNLHKILHDGSLPDVINRANFLSIGPGVLILWGVKFLDSP